MPVLYDDIRTAISAAIVAGDPTCPVANIHQRRRNPVNPNKQVLFDLLGKQVSGQDRYHGYDMTRRDSLETEMEGEADDDVIISYQELWVIRSWYSFIDSDDTETAFQKALNNVRDQLRGSIGIRNLITTWDVIPGAVNISPISLQYLASDELVHSAELSIRFTHTGHGPNQ